MPAVLGIGLGPLNKCQRVGVTFNQFRDRVRGRYCIARWPCLQLFFGEMCVVREVPVRSSSDIEVRVVVNQVPQRSAPGGGAAPVCRDYLPHFVPVQQIHQHADVHIDASSFSESTIDSG